MAQSHIPPEVAAVARRRRAYRAAAVLTSLVAFMGMALLAGPVTAAGGAMPCALPRTDAHHSLGTDTWDDAYKRPRGTFDAALVFLSFPDAKPKTTPAELTADHFPDTTRFFDETSYGAFHLRPHSAHRWITMPRPSTAYGIQRDWDPERRTDYLRDAIDVVDPRLDFAKYDVVYLIADPDAPGVDSDATKVVNFDEPVEVDGGELRRLVTVFEQSPPDRHVLAHETAHVFDLPDLYQQPEDGKADWDTRVGDWDLMGSQFGLAPEPFAWHRWKIGWLGPRNIDCAPARHGVTRHSLRPVSAPSGGADGASVEGPDGTRMAVVRTGTSSAIAVEARTRQGGDASVCREGVLMYRVHSDTASTHGPVEVIDGHPGTSACLRTSVHPALADAPLGVGEGHVTKEGVRVEVTGRGADGEWEVKITK